MSRKGENIFKRKDGRWEARYIKGYGEDGKAVYGYVFGKSYMDAKRKRVAREATIPCSPSVHLATATTAISVGTCASDSFGVAGLLSTSRCVELIEGASSEVSRCSSDAVAARLACSKDSANSPHSIGTQKKLKPEPKQESKPESKQKPETTKPERAVSVATAKTATRPARPELIADIAMQWLEELKPLRKHSTIVKYEGQIRNYIIPILGEKRLTKLKNSDIVVFVKELLTITGRGKQGAEGHLAPRTIASILAKVKAIRRFAILRGYRVRFTTNCIELPRKQDKIKVLSNEEQRKLLAYVRKNLNLTTFGILLALFTGIRLGELCALKWSDFSIEDGEFRVQRTMQRLSAASSSTVSSMLAGSDSLSTEVGNAGNVRLNIRDNAGGVHGNSSGSYVMKTGRGSRTRVEVGTPKSPCSVRTIPIPKALMEYIQYIRRFYLEGRGCAGHAGHAVHAPYGTHSSSAPSAPYMPSTGNTVNTLYENCFVLTGSTHYFVEPRTMENRFKAVLKKCGLRDINFHALRHSFATRCVELGFDVKTLSEILGHANVNITLNRYVHPSMKLKHENMNKLSELLEG